MLSLQQIMKRFTNRQPNDPPVQPIEPRRNPLTDPAAEIVRPTPRVLPPPGMPTAQRGPRVISGIAQVTQFIGEMNRRMAALEDRVASLEGGKGSAAPLSIEVTPDEEQ